MKVGDLVLNLIINGKQATVTVNNIGEKLEEIEHTGNRATETIQGGFLGVKKSILAAVGGITAGIVAIKGVINTAQEWISAANEQAKAEAKVAQAVKQTGNAAGFSARQLKDVAASLQELTAIGDEKILNEVTANLLTFTNIAGNNFLRAQQAALDIATVLDGDLKSAAIQLGKALNDPVENLSALTRSGIQFTEQQEEQIKSLVKSGDLYQAQAIILAEINRQYGGQAQAVAEASGAFKKLQNTLGDLSEVLGGFLIDALEPIAGTIKLIADGIINLIAPKAKSDIDNLTESVIQQRLEYDQLSTTLLILKERTSLTEAENKLYQETIDKLNAQYPNYLKNVNLEKDSFNQVADALADARSALDKYLETQVKSAILKEKQDELINIGKQIAEMQIAKVKLEAEIRNARRTGVFDGVKYEDVKQMEYAISVAQEAMNGSFANTVMTDLEAKREQLRSEIEIIENYITGLGAIKPVTVVPVEVNDNTTKKEIEARRKMLEEFQDYKYQSGRMELEEYKSILDARIEAYKKNNDTERTEYLRLVDLRRSIETEDYEKARELYEESKAREVEAFEEQLTRIDYLYETNRIDRDRYVELLRNRLNTAQSLYGKESIEYMKLLDKKKKYDDDYIKNWMLVNSQRASNYTGTLSNMLAQTKDISDSMFRLWKASAIAHAIISTYAGAAKAIEQWGYPLGAIMAAAAIIQGLVYVSKISETRFKSEAYAKGGMITEPTLALMGEAGAEIVAPKQDFLQVVNAMINRGELTSSNKTDTNKLAEVIENLNDTINNLELTANIDIDGVSVLVERGNKLLRAREY